MLQITTVGLDLAKNVFQAHGADASGRAVLRKKLRRDQVLAFFSQLQPCVVAMEACGGAHFWGREIRRAIPQAAAHHRGQQRHHQTTRPCPGWPRAASASLRLLWHKPFVSREDEGRVRGQGAVWRKLRET